jgi:nucleoid-associated protein YgaU
MSDEKKGFFDRAMDAMTNRDELAAAEAAKKEAAAALKAKAEAEAKAARDAAAKAAAEAKAAKDATAKAAAEAKAKAAEVTAAAAQKQADEANAKMKEMEAKLKAMEDSEAKRKAEAAAEAMRKQSEELARRLATKHTVASGDTLSAISLKYYKTANRWKEIYEANKDVIGDNPSLIKPGMELVIPDADKK